MSKRVSPGSRKRVAIYARVSTDGQTVENQLRELRKAARRHGWTVAATYTDEGISGAKGRDRRPGFDDLHGAIARKEVDLVAAWSVDRLGRSLQDLVGFLGEVHAKGIDLYLHLHCLDTTTPAGRAMFGMLGVFAEFERAMIQERVRAGLERARRQGKRLGRPKKATPMTIRKIGTARDAGKSMRAIAHELGVSASLVHAVYSRRGSQGVIQRAKEAQFSSTWVPQQARCLLLALFGPLHPEEQSCRAVAERVRG